MIPDTDYITDRAANNFCDDFQVKLADKQPANSSQDAIEKAKKLLGG